MAHQGFRPESLLPYCFTRQVTGRVNTTLSFCLVTLVYIMLGLLEVD